MKIDKRWAVLLALVGGAAIATAFVSRLRRYWHQEMRQLRTDLHAWEDEGGNLAPSEVKAPLS